MLQMFATSSSLKWSNFLHSEQTDNFLSEVVSMSIHWRTWLDALIESRYYAANVLRAVVSISRLRSPAGFGWQIRSWSVRHSHTNVIVLSYCLLGFIYFYIYYTVYHNLVSVLLKHMSCGTCWFFIAIGWWCSFTWNYVLSLIYYLLMSPMIIYHYSRRSCSPVGKRHTQVSGRDSPGTPKQDLSSWFVNPAHWLLNLVLRLQNRGHGFWINLSHEPRGASYISDNLNGIYIWTIIQCITTIL